MVHALAFAAIVALFGLSFFAYVALRALLGIFIEKVRLSGQGVRTRGTCVGYTSGRYGNGVVVTFADVSGMTNRMVASGWEGVLPGKGSKVEVVYLPQNPKVAGVWPVRALIPNAIYMTVAVPVLLAAGMACLLAIAWIARTVWFSG
ncbi:DUF3592 domain-containing protein [Streptomyces sp. CA-278952]|uniref:DUF3592 domain-containing protein n=1 Tax=unclassified Streptomyces TaxID=2593676 RepID=UPI0023676B67|nr:DUF3592 domain-containing protein [Streptomyces sp. CA-278952]WDG27439.1 DUF3592 domain-containing protein [Streptomyces sp. CA-278952]